MSKSTKPNIQLDEVKLALDNLNDARKIIRRVVKQLEKIGHYDEADELENSLEYELEEVERFLKELLKIVK